MKIPAALIERLQTRRVVPFAGAGVSMAVLDRDSKEPLFPSWSELLLAAADKLEQESKPEDANLVRSLLGISNPNFLYAATHARQALGPLWYEFLRHALDIPHSRVDDGSLELARSIWRLGSQLIVTTNYDEVLRWACPDQNDLQSWDMLGTKNGQRNRKKQSAKRHDLVDAMQLTQFAKNFDEADDGKYQGTNIDPEYRRRQAKRHGDQSRCDDNELLETAHDAARPRGDFEGGILKRPTKGSQSDCDERTRFRDELELNNGYWYRIVNFQLRGGAAPERHLQRSNICARFHRAHRLIPDLIQTFHVWLPSSRRSAAKNARLHRAIEN